MPLEPAIPPVPIEPVSVPVPVPVVPVPIPEPVVSVPVPEVPVPELPVGGFEPGVLPGGLTVGEVVEFWSMVGVVGPEPFVPGVTGWLGLLFWAMLWSALPELAGEAAKATPPERASTAAPQSAKPLMCI